MITIEEINEIKKALQADLVPVGTIIIYSSLEPPAGYLPCDGRTVAKSNYPQLYAAIGGIFGEYDSGFNLPDLRGQFVRGYDPSHRFDIDYDRQFGEHQQDALQGHQHAAQWEKAETGAAGAHRHLFYANYWARYPSSNYDSRVHENRDFEPSTNYNKTTSSVEDHTHSLPSLVIGEAGSTNYGKVNLATETRPKNIALNFCIKFE